MKPAFKLIALLGLAAVLTACGPQLPPEVSTPPQSTQATTLPTVPTTVPTSSAPTVPTTLPTQPAPTEPAPTEPVMLEKLVELYAQNEHTAGWVQVEGTMINYPVMQTPDEPEWRDYYLHRNFDRQEEFRGCIYAREKCDLLAPSDNIVLYGHNMADHTMFGEVMDYRYYDHYLTHKYIQFSNLYEEHTYEIFAVFRTSAAPDAGYPYHRFNEATDAADFDAFVAQCKALSLYAIDLTPTYGQKLLTLSTCDLSFYQGRLVVVAVCID